MDKLYKASCDEDEFMIRGHDRGEIRDIIKMHVEKMHKIKVSDSEAEEKVKEI